MARATICKRSRQAKPTKRQVLIGLMIHRIMSMQTNNEPLDEQTVAKEVAQESDDTGPRCTRADMVASDLALGASIGAPLFS